MYYVLFRCWPGFRLGFPIERFFALSDDELARELDVFAAQMADLHALEILQYDACVEARREKAGTAVICWEPAICHIGRALGWYVGGPVPEWGQPYSWRHLLVGKADERLAKCIVKEVQKAFNKHRDLSLYVNARFYIVPVDSITEAERDEIELDFDRQLQGAGFSNDATMASEIIRLAQSIIEDCKKKVDPGFVAVESWEIERARQFWLPATDEERERAELTYNVSVLAQQWKELNPVDGQAGGNGERQKTSEGENCGSIPAAYREGGKPNGLPLTTRYLASEPEWNLAKDYISKNYSEDGDKPLTKRIKQGKGFVYLFTELAALRRTKTESEKLDDPKKIQELAAEMRRKRSQT